MKKRLLFLLFQFASVFCVSFISYLLRPLPVLYYILIYGFVPLFSAIFSLKLVVKSVNPYLAWILPPVAQSLGGLLAAMGIAPDPLPVMVTAFISLVGAAAGDVINKTNKKGRK